MNELQEFPPASKLDPKLYGNQNSSISKEQIENNLDGLSIDEVKFLMFLISKELSQFVDPSLKL